MTGPGVVTGRYGTIGEVFYIEEPFWPLNTALYVRDFKGSDPRFISFFLRTIDFHAYSDKAAVPGVNRNHLHQASVVIPPLKEQRAIAVVLGTLDDKIEQNRRTGQALERLARANFRAWFVDFEPVHAKAAGATSFPSMPPDVFDTLPTRFVDSSIGPTPTGWTVKHIGELIDFSYGKPLKAENRQPGRIPVYGANGQVGWHSEPLVTRPGIVVGRKGNPGTVNRVSGPFYPIDTTFYVESKVDDLPIQIQFYLLDFLSLHRLSADSAVPGLNRNMAANEPCVVAPTPVLLSAASIIGSLWTLVDCLSNESCKLAELRDYLLPKLLSGAVRVRDAEKWADEPDAFAFDDDQPSAARASVSMQCDLSGSSGSPLAVKEESEEPAVNFGRGGIAVAEADDTRSSGADHRPLSIDAWSTDKAMAAFRQAVRNRGAMTRDELLKRAAQELGFQRLGSAIRERLKSHMRAALRRQIIAADGPDMVLAETTSMSDYTIDELVDALRSVMRKGQAMQREDAIRAVASHLGFTRLVSTVQTPVKSAINGAIRRGILERDRNLIWRK